jgi:hypothetical protein
MERPFGGALPSRTAAAADKNFHTTLQRLLELRCLCSRRTKTTIAFCRYPILLQKLVSQLSDKDNFDLKG